MMSLKPTKPKNRTIAKAILIALTWLNMAGADPGPRSAPQSPQTELNGNAKTTDGALSAGANISDHPETSQSGEGQAKGPEATNENQQQTQQESKELENKEEIERKAKEAAAAAAAAAQQQETERLKKAEEQKKIEQLNQENIKLSIIAIGAMGLLAVLALIKSNLKKKDQAYGKGLYPPVVRKTMSVVSPSPSQPPSAAPSISTSIINNVEPQQAPQPTITPNENPAHSGQAARFSFNPGMIIFGVALLGIGFYLSKTNEESNVEVRRGPYIRAGSFICQNQYQVMGQRQLKRLSPYTEAPGCSAVGINVLINILGEDQRVGALRVGNAGAVGWVDMEDVVQ